MSLSSCWVISRPTSSCSSRHRCLDTSFSYVLFVVRRRHGKRFADFSFYGIYFAVPFFNVRACAMNTNSDSAWTFAWTLNSATWVMWRFASMGGVPFIQKVSLLLTSLNLIPTLFSKYHSSKTESTWTNHVELTTFQCMHVVCLQVLLWVIAFGCHNQRQLHSTRVIFTARCTIVQSISVRLSVCLWRWWIMTT